MRNSLSGLGDFVPCPDDFFFISTPYGILAVTIREKWLVDENLDRLEDQSNIGRAVAHLTTMLQSQLHLHF
jgi:hypothetical protein